MDTYFPKIVKRKLNRKIITLIAIVPVLLSFIGIALTTKPSTDTRKVSQGQTAFPEITKTPEKLYKVVRVIDGDTIEIEGGQSVRYIGIDTPETVHSSKPIECYGIEATDKNIELVQGKEVRLEKDISETDKYGRLLRYVWVDDIFVNDYLVREGYGVSSTYLPDVKYQAQLRQAESLARKLRKGLWGETCGNLHLPATR